MALAVALVALDDLRRLLGDLRRAGAHVDVEPARDPLAQVAVQRALDLAVRISSGQPMIRRCTTPRLKSLKSSSLACLR